MLNADFQPSLRAAALPVSELPGTGGWVKRRSHGLDTEEREQNHAKQYQSMTKT